MLFAIDEILSGTNSRDRRVAAESFLRALIGAPVRSARCPLTTWLWPKSPRIRIWEDRTCTWRAAIASDPFAFDYLLKPGVSTHSNALAIARMAGVIA